MTKQEYIDQLFDTMNQLRKAIGSQTQESHEEKFATMMQYSALVNLQNNKNATVGDIARHLKLSKSSSTQLVERLVKSGFVDRISDKDDRRVVRISITAVGEEHVLELKKKYKE